MEIKTKFNIGDTALIISDSTIKQFKIVGIKILVFDNGSIAIKYLDAWNVDIYDKTKHEFYEDECFASKEELCQSILNNIK